MRSFGVLPCFFLAPALIVAQTRSMSWNDLGNPEHPDWTIRMVLPDGTAIEGKPARFEPEVLSMRIVRTSDKALHPKGEISIPRDQVKVVEIRQNRHKARRIGVLVPVAAGVGLGVGLAASVGTDCTFLCGIAAGAALGFGLVVAAVGGTVGYFVGRSIDRRFVIVAVKQP